MELFHACCELGPDERSRLLEEASDDTVVRGEVEAMLAFDVERPTFLSVKPAFPASRQPLARLPCWLWATRFGVFDGHASLAHPLQYDSHQALSECSSGGCSSPSTSRMVWR